MRAATVSGPIGLRDCRCRFQVALATALAMMCSVPRQPSRCDGVECARRPVRSPRQIELIFSKSLVRVLPDQRLAVEQELAGAIQRRQVLVWSPRGDLAQGVVKVSDRSRDENSSSWAVQAIVRPLPTPHSKIPEAERRRVPGPTSCPGTDDHRRPVGRPSPDRVPQGIGLRPPLGVLRRSHVRARSSSQVVPRAAARRTGRIARRAAVSRYDAARHRPKVPLMRRPG